MDEKRILAAVEAAGEVPASELFAAARSNQAAINLTNTLAKMRRTGQVIAVKKPEVGTVYRLPTSQGGDV